MFNRTFFTWLAATTFSLFCIVPAHNLCAIGNRHHSTPTNEKKADLRPPKTPIKQKNTAPTVAEYNESVQPVIDPLQTQQQPEENYEPTWYERALHKINSVGEFFFSNHPSNEPSQGPESFFATCVKAPFRFIKGVTKLISAPITWITNKISPPLIQAELHGVANGIEHILIANPNFSADDQDALMAATMPLASLIPSGTICLTQKLVGSLFNVFVKEILTGKKYGYGFGINEDKLKELDFKDESKMRDGIVHLVCDHFHKDDIKKNYDNAVLVVSLAKQISHTFSLGYQLTHYADVVRRQKSPPILKVFIFAEMIATTITMYEQLTKLAPAHIPLATNHDTAHKRLNGFATLIHTLFHYKEFVIVGVLLTQIVYSAVRSHFKNKRAFLLRCQQQFKFKEDDAKRLYSLIKDDDLPEAEQLLRRYKISPKRFVTDPIIEKALSGFDGDATETTSCVDCTGEPYPSTATLKPSLQH